MLLSVSHLKKSFELNTVLKDVSFSLEKGHSIAIIGGSGSGKSVLLKCIIGLVRKDSGLITYKNKDIEGFCFDPSIRFGMLFQSGALFDGMTVLENIGFHLLKNEKRDLGKIRLEVERVLEEVDLDPEVADFYPDKLSGGMKKRVALARAIITKPDILLFDEPTTGLDPILSHTINVLIRKILKNRGASAIIITHDMHSMRYIADRVAFLYEGTIAWEGPVRDLDKSPVKALQKFVKMSA